MPQLIWAIPLGVGASLSCYVAACQRTLKQVGLDRPMNGYDNNIEGDWDEVMDAV